MSEVPLNDNIISSTTTQDIPQENNLSLDYLEIGIQQSISIVCIILSTIYFPLMGIKSIYNFYVFGSCLFFNIIFYFIAIKKLVISKNKEKNTFIIEIIKTCGCKKILEYNREDIFFGLEENSGYPFFFIIKNYLNKKDFDFQNIMKNPPIKLIEGFGYLATDTFVDSVKFLLNILNDNNPIAVDVNFEPNHYFVNSLNYYSYFVNSQPSNNDQNTYLYFVNFFIHFVISILICFFDYLVYTIVGCCLLIIFIGSYYGMSRSIYRIDFFFSQEQNILIIGYVRMNQSSYEMINFFLLSDFEKFAVVNDGGNRIKLVRTTGQLIEVFNAKDDNIYILEEFVGILNKCMPQKQV